MLTTAETISELESLRETCSDLAISSVLEQVIMRLEIYQQPRPIEVAPNGEYILAWSPEYGWYQTRFSGMDTEAKLGSGYTHWLPMPPRPEED